MFLWEPPWRMRAALEEGPTAERWAGAVRETGGKPVRIPVPGAVPSSPAPSARAVGGRAAEAGVNPRCPKRVPPPR